MNTFRPQRGKPARRDQSRSQGRRRRRRRPAVASYQERPGESSPKRTPPHRLSGGPRSRRRGPLQGRAGRRRTRSGSCAGDRGDRDVHVHPGHEHRERGTPDDATVVRRLHRQHPVGQYRLHAVPGRGRAGQRLAGRPDRPAPVVRDLDAGVLGVLGTVRHGRRPEQHDLLTGSCRPCRAASSR